MPKFRTVALGYDAAEAAATKREDHRRLDGDVLDFFRATGIGWQTRLKAVLRLFMQART